MNEYLFISLISNRLEISDKLISINILDKE
jgi:hypothetical protein